MAITFVDVKCADCSAEFTISKELRSIVFDTYLYYVCLLCRNKRRMAEVTDVTGFLLPEVVPDPPPEWLLNEV